MNTPMDYTECKKDIDLDIQPNDIVQDNLTSVKKKDIFTHTLKGNSENNLETNEEILNCADDEEVAVKLLEHIVGSWQLIEPPEPIIKKFSFQELSPGFRNIPDDILSPCQFVSLFLDKEFFWKLATDTNCYAAEKLISTKNSLILTFDCNISVKEWTPTNSNEMQAFAGLALACSLLRKHNLTSFWDENTSFFATPGFSRVMTKNRFLLLLNFVCYDYKENAGDNNNLFQYFNNNYKKYFVPSCDLYINDVSIINDSNSLPVYVNQFTQNKGHCGIRLWQLCETNSGYCCKVTMSTGMREEVKHTEGEQIVNILMEDYLDKGYHLHVNTICAFRLMCEALYVRKTHISGTVCKNSQLPLKMKSDKQSSDTKQVYYRKGPILTTRYSDDKRDSCFLISTCSQADEVIAVTHDKEIKIPEIVHTLSTGLGFQHVKDQFTWYPDNELPLSNQTKLLFNVISCSFYNAYVLYSLKRGKISSFKFYSEALADLASVSTGIVMADMIPSTSLNSPSQITLKNVADSTPMINPSSVTTIGLNKWNSLD